MHDTNLRLALRQCQSRICLALGALDDFQEVLLAAAGPLPITDVTRLVAMMDGIRSLLTGEGGE
jgi:hypothetical protein